MPGPNRGGPDRGGPDALEDQLRAVERIFNSPLIKRYLELMEENAELRARVQVQEKLMAREHERAANRPERQPVRENAGEEREQQERMRAMIEAREQNAKVMLDRLQAEKQEMAQQIEKLKERLKDVQAAQEKTRDESNRKKKKDD